MIRRLAPVAAAVAAVAVVVPAAPAHADDELGLSRDGVSWSADLGAPLFEPGLRLVPGDVETRSFLVRNDGPSAGVLTVNVVAGDPDALLASGSLSVEAQVGGGSWVPVGIGRTRAVTALEVARGARTKVSVRARFAAESTAQQLSDVPFRLRLRLSEDGDVGGVDEGAGGPGDGGAVGGESEGLPGTGAGVTSGLVWLAAGLVGAGLALIRRGRTDGGQAR